MAMKVYDAEPRTNAIYANRSLNINNDDTGIETGGTIRAWPWTLTSRKR